VASLGGGRRSVLRVVAFSLAQRALDALGHRSEGGFAVERCENGAADQGRAA
jgi:hypothetical protein